MILYILYTIVNYALLVTFFKTHSPHASTYALYQ